MTEREPGQLAWKAYRRAGWAWWEELPRADKQIWARIEAAIRADERAKNDARTERMEAALRKLLKLNDEHSPFGGEVSRDKIDRAWDEARAALADAPAPAPTNVDHIKLPLPTWLGKDTPELREKLMTFVRSTAAAPVQGDGEAKRAECCHKTVMVHCEGCPYIPVARCLCFRCTVAAPVSNGGE